MPDTASAVVRWAAFSCVLVPVVLVWYGTSLAGAAGTALGLAAVTGVCRVLLRQSERGAALLRAEEQGAGGPRAEERAPHRGRHGRSWPQDLSGVIGSRIATGAPGRSNARAHRGGRHGGGNKPVD
ncbi:hypothetical protein [Streptomyces sp. NPDC001530]|uniref:hypothetical protein n=1 Tax=Streptomyces sp. NPDC001530 TaxID=3364582 RepID=UPI0036B28351